MGNSCILVPKKGASFFRKASEKLGRNNAIRLYDLSVSQKFRNTFGKKLEYDEENFPTVESMMSIPEVKNAIEVGGLIDNLNARSKAIPETRYNYEMLVKQAYSINEQQKDNRYMAEVERTDDGIRLSYVMYDEDKERAVRESYSIVELNRRLGEILKPLGVEVSDLSMEELSAGINGVTEFSKLKDVAKGFSAVAKVANNIRGSVALSEEFSHILVKALKGNVFMQRALDSMQDENKLREVFGDLYERYFEQYDGDIELMAEEAVGKVLRDHLLTHVSEETPIPNKSLFRRLIDWIWNLFKKTDFNEIDKSIVESDALIDEVSKRILRGIIDIDLKNAMREHDMFTQRLYSLEEETDKYIAVVDNILDVERKRYKMQESAGNDEKKDQTGFRIDRYSEGRKNTAEAIKVIYLYCKTALKTLKGIEKDFDVADRTNLKDKFKYIREVHSYLKSYAPFIEDLNALIEDEKKEEKSAFLEDVTTYFDKEVHIDTLARSLNAVFGSLRTMVAKEATPIFIEYLQSHFGDTIKTLDENKQVVERSIKDILKKAERGDISLLDRWLDSMANSSDEMLQMYANIVYELNDKARFKTLDDVRRIQALGKRMEEAGFSNYEWMFAHDEAGNKTGDYVAPVDYRRFWEEYKAFLENINKQYGDAYSRREARERAIKIQQWIDEHAEYDEDGSIMPREDKYQNPEWLALSREQQDLLTEYLELKNEFADDFVNKNAYSCIQVRKNSVERLTKTKLSPSDIYQNLKESFASSLLDGREDDDVEFGSIYTNAMQDFDGTEFMTLPKLYTNRLKNPNDLSTDVIGALMQYAYATNKYKAINEEVDALEVGRLLLQYREIAETRGGQLVAEKLKVLGEETVRNIYKKDSYIMDKLDDFMKAQIYGRTLEDQGATTVAGKRINNQKAAGKLLHINSLVRLGFNTMTQIANVTLGKAMQRIDAISRQWYGYENLLYADKEYMSLLPSFMAELNSRTKTNKLALMFELLDLKGDYGNRIRKSQDSSLIKRMFGETISHLGQEAGDHYLYSRTMIAMCNRMKVLKNGEEMTLWDALQVVDAPEGEGLMMIDRSGITDLDGNEFDFGKFGRKVAKVNGGLFGIYNEEDMAMASRYIAGRFLLSFRKWIKPQFNKRFQKAQYDQTLETVEEGYYRTFFNFLYDVYKSKFRILAVWDSLKEDEQYKLANVKRAIAELVQFAAISIIAGLLKGGKDKKKRIWGLKLMEYIFVRLQHETGALTISLRMPSDWLQTLKTPVPMVNTVEDMFKFGSSVLNPKDWTDILQSGPYKGHTKLYKNAMKFPVPYLSYAHQFRRFGKIDDTIDYYRKRL